MPIGTTRAGVASADRLHAGQPRDIGYLMGIGDHRAGAVMGRPRGRTLQPDERTLGVDMGVDE
jgi:hypothetical protein